MKAGVAYLIAAAVVVAIAGRLLVVGFSTAPDVEAIEVSAGIVLGAQLCAFAITRWFGVGRAMAGIGVSAILRLFVLASYAALIGTLIQVPAAAALLSMAVFFFLSSLMEPLFLRL